MSPVVTVLAALTTYIAICAVLAAVAAGMVLSVGSLLRLGHYEFADLPSFLLLRRYGVRRGIWPYLRDVIRRSRRSRSAALDALHQHIWLVIVPSICWFISAIFIGIGTLSLQALWKTMEVQAGPTLQIVPMMALMGAVAGTWIFLRGFGYIARPW